MNKIKVDYARNGVRIALNSKIILLCALAFLCLAIVFLCVFNYLNALATDNIAFADGDERELDEEPLRQTSTGFYEDNLYPNNYCLNWDYSYSFINETVVFYQGDGWNFCVQGTGSLTNYIFSATGSSLKIWFYPSSSLNSSTYSFGLGWGYYSGGNPSIARYIDGSVVNETSITSANSWSSIRNNTWSIDSNHYYYISIPQGCNFPLTFICLQQASYFRGYVSPDYQYYGYNQGYADGYADGEQSGGGSSEPTLVYPISSGIVQDNLMTNADCVMWQYNLVGSTAPGTVFSSNSDWSYSIIGSAGQLAYNTFTCSAGSSSELCFSKLSSLSPGDYVFTVGSTSISSSYDIEVLYGGSRLASETSISTTGFTSVSFTISDNNSRSRDSLYLNLYVMLSGDSSVELSFLKLETGSYFSGFVPSYYGITDYEAYETGWQYGYQRGRQLGYDAGFEDGLVANDVSWDALYELAGHLDIVLNLLPENFANSESIAYNNPLGSTNIIFEYNGIIYENSGYIANCVPDGAAVTIKKGSNNASYTAIKIASNVSGVVTIPYVANNTGYRFMVVNGNIPTFRNAYGYNYVVGGLPCLEFDVGNNSDIYIVANTMATDLPIDVGNIFIDGFSPIGIYKYNANTQQYQNGFNQGVRQGRSYAESEIQEAFESGKVVGRNEASNYTFSSLIGAVIDTPITAAKGLLDFNILGTNLYGLFVGLLSLAVVLFIIRIFSRGL